MSDISQRPKIEIHPDFPNEPIQGAVSGTHPKILLRKTFNGMYTLPRRSPADVVQRFEAANDITNQLVKYFKRKKAEHPEWTDEKNIERIRLALVKNSETGKWPFSEAEQSWIINRLWERRNS